MTSQRGNGVVSITGSKGRGALARLGSYLRVSAGVVALLANSAAWAQQLPTGGSVAAGAATIAQPNSSTLNINQSTNQAVINWNSFSVGRGGTVNFNQPNSSSATLNRVTGSTPSWIAGTINAPGTVLLVNPNGIAITKSGVVNTGSFAASTLDISNADFMAGNYKFTGNGGSAAVRNSGRINVSDGGFAALLGGQVANNGVISARLGKVGLGAGELITLDLAGDGFLSVAVPSSQVGKLVDASGALVTNSGKIRANGGQVFLSAATATNILRDAVNVPGSIRANTVGTHNGRIVIGGGTGGKVTVTGRLAANGGTKRNGGKIEVSGANVALNGKVTANGKNGGNITVASSGDLSVAGKVEAKGNDGQGGRIDLTGANIKVVGALIDASGATGGGLVRIGGTFQGGNGDPNDPLYQSFIGRFRALPTIVSAQTVTIDNASTINVSAKVAGNGGTAIVWSEQVTSFTGTILGNGGSNAGNGGFTEVSSHDLLDYQGTANLLAPAGETGTLLLDPNNLVISTGTTSGAGSTPNYVAGQASSVLKNTDLQTALASANITVTASGNISVTGTVTWSSNSNLTLDAGGTLTIGSGSAGSLTNTTSTTAILTLKSGGAIAESGTATIKIANLVIIPTAGTVQTVTLNNSNVVTNLAANVASLSFKNVGALNIATIGATSGITATGALTLNVTGTITDATAPISVGSFTLTNGNWTQNSASLATFTATTGFTVNTSNGATFLRVLGGDGTSIATAYQIADIYGLQGMGSVGANFALANDINASGTATWNANKGFVPIQSLDNDFNGNGHTISGLKIVFNGNIINGVGLFDGISSSGTVENLNLSGGSITSGTWTDGSTGALAGLNQGTISNVTSSVAIGGLGSSMGGLVGYNTGTITKSSASGAVTGADGSDNTNYSYDVGGLVGGNSGTITLSHASGAVKGNQWVGGLAGVSNGVISDSYATGSATAMYSSLGGLVGENQGGTITRTYATGTVTETGSYQTSNPYYVGGLVGKMTGGSLSYSYFTGTVNATQASAVGGLVGGLLGDQSGSPATVSNSYATGAVNGAFYTGGLIGEIENGSSVTAAYADNTVTSGIGAAVGGVVGTNGPFSTPGTLTSVYWNKTTSGLNAASGDGTTSGALGRTNAQFHDAANQATNFAGFDFNNVWSPPDATHDPQLYGVSYVVRVNSAGSYQYGDTIAPTFLSLQNGDSTSIITGLVYTTNAPANPQVGQTYTASASGASATSSNGVAYRFIYNNGTVTITTRAVTVTANAQSITYGDSDPSLTYAITSGSLYGTDSFSGALSRNAGTNAGTYAITLGNLALSSNYTVTYVGANLTINKKTLTETLTGTVEKTYDKNTTATLNSSNYGALVGIINGDSVSLISMPTSGTYNNANAGTGKTVTVNGLSLTGAAAGNYTIASSASGVVGVIDKKVLTETLTGTITKTYNGTNAATLTSANYTTLSGIIAGDTVSLASKPTTVGVTYADENAGTGKVVTVTGLTLTGSAAGNYTISIGSGAIGTITPKALTVSLTGTTTKTYDAGTNATLAQSNYSLSGLVSGDSVSVSNTSATYNNANVGAGKTVSVSGLSLGGADGGNYTVSVTTASGAIGAITPATLTYVANVASRGYGDANPALSGIVTGFVGGQTQATVTTGTLAFNSSAGLTSNVGNYGITGSGLTANNGNYVFVQAAANATALTVNPATLTFTANTASRDYGDANPALSGGVTGFKNGQTATTFGGDTWTTLAGLTSNVGNYGISGGLTNASPNYTIVQAGANTTALTVNKATLTFTANTASRDYGDANPALSGGVTGFKNGQTAATFGGDTWTTTAGLTSNVGNYGITGGLTNASPNYTVVQAAANTSALTVNPATLTYAADAMSRITGAPNPVFTGTVTGFVNNETLATATTGALLFSSFADTSSPAGSYAVNGSGLAAVNYVFVQAAGNATALTVNQAGGGAGPSQFNSRPDPSGVPKDVNISFQPQGTGGPIAVSFTPPAPPPVRLSNTPSTDIAPAALPAGQNLSTNNGLTYLPISQFDANQYSPFKLADWADQAGLAAIYVMLARGIDQPHAADAFIDGFWNGTSPAWTPLQSFTGKVTFSDGAGNNVAPTGNAGFAIVAGTTDFGQLLKSGPVMISNGATPAHWLLATQLTSDGKGIVANDPASGKQVVLNYDAATKTVGGVTSVFDANSNKFVPFAEASAGTPALAGMQGFVPSTFLAVAH
jgi:filamentous hemagglutinin family protein